MHITFLGAADTVTGSRHRGEIGDQCILLDCGMFQGYKVLRERNWADDGLVPRDLDAVVLSHAHLDHSGWLPVLVKRGYRGPIYASPATRDLASVLLLDAATSAIDNETEAAIQESLAHVSIDRTTIVIAHRLSTIRHAHRIHVMEAGRIIEAGDHDELIALGGLYAALWRVQTGERTSS